MPHVITSLKRSSSTFSKPLKKRPIVYDSTGEFLSDSDQSSKGLSLSPPPMDDTEPENLSTKPEDLRLHGKEKSLSSPPPILLVAGRGNLLSQNIKSETTNQIKIENTSIYGDSRHGAEAAVGVYNMSNYGPISPPPHLIKPLSGGPLEQINLNPPATWHKISPYVPQPLSFSSLPRLSPQGLAQYPHFAPTGGFRDSGSPPHVSPPLSHEPAYPVLRIEESHRSRLSTSPPSAHQTDFSPIPNFHPNHNHQDCHSHHQVEPVYYTHHQQLSPTYSHCSDSRDSVISHGKVKPSQNRVTSSTNNSNKQDQSATIIPVYRNGASRYVCEQCNKSYSTQSGLTKHVQFHCASQNVKDFVCKYCPKVYHSLGALKMHIRTHTLPCKCNICGKAFSRPWLLQGHIRTHTGEKPFSCQHCNRAFADRSNLRAHLQTHSEVKKYSCKCCSKTFSRMSLLVKHEEGGCTSSSMSLSQSE